MESIVNSRNNFETIWYDFRTTYVSQALPYTVQKFNSEWIIHLDIKDRTVKLLRESIEENPYKLRRGKNYLK